MKFDSFDPSSDFQHGTATGRVTHIDKVVIASGPGKGDFTHKLTLQAMSSSNISLLLTPGTITANLHLSVTASNDASCKVGSAGLVVLRDAPAGQDRVGMRVECRGVLGHHVIVQDFLNGPKTHVVAAIVVPKIPA